MSRMNGFIIIAWLRCSLIIKSSEFILLAQSLTFFLITEVEK